MLYVDRAPVYMTFPMIEIVFYVCETLAIVVQLGWLVLFLNIT